MSAVGQIEKQTQARIVALFRDRLGYAYLGNWMDWAGNGNIEPELLRARMKSRSAAGTLVARVLQENCPLFLKNIYPFLHASN
jgi:type I restriction enzyme R subunit